MSTNIPEPIACPPWCVRHPGGIAVPDEEGYISHGAPAAIVTLSDGTVVRAVVEAIVEDLVEHEPLVWIQELVAKSPDESLWHDYAFEQVSPQDARRIAYAMSGACAAAEPEPEEGRAAIVRMRGLMRASSEAIGHKAGVPAEALDAMLAGERFMSRGVAERVAMAIGEVAAAR